MAGDWIGETIGGCRIIRELARGGMATIYLAEQLSVKREVALKMMSANLLGDPTFMERFTREVGTTARLQHPHIIPIYDYGQHEDTPFIVMAYLPGGSLADLLATGPLALGEIARLVGQVAQALDYAHSYGVIHRDVKPANVLLGYRRNAVLTDFGVARVVNATPMLTHDMLVGTPSYLAPELISQEQPPTSACDIYGLGVTLYQMLTGELPFRSDSAVQTMWAHVNEPAPLASTRRPDLPPAIDAVVQKALAKSPDARYATASELADDLADVAAGQAPQRAEAAPPTRFVAASETQVRRLEEAVHNTIDQVVKIARPDGASGGGIYVVGDQVLTCLHVVEGAPGLYVRFRTGEQIEADVQALDREMDLALLKLRETPQSLSVDRLDGIVFDFGDLEPGAPLAAIGHPLNLDWAVTGGHYNGLRLPGDESMRRFGVNLAAPLVQVDVAINPGNSGGPLIDTAARLIGLADSMINPALANNIGFAIQGQAVYGFWQAHKDDDVRLVAYTCHHHHEPELAYCPLTGRSVTIRASAPMPPLGAARYSCGHHHPPGLAYCPLTGKPVQPVDAQTGPQSADELTPGGSVTCSNCHHEYPAELHACPHCGKSRPR